MKTYIILITILILCSPTFASDFSSRVAKAKELSSTSEGAQYETTMGPHIGAAMQACIPSGSTDHENLGSFTLVANVSMAGELKSVVVEPKTKISSCFAEHFGKSILPNPPNINLSNGYPILIEMQVTP